jgi:hypothetical protein
VGVLSAYGPDLPVRIDRESDPAAAACRYRHAEDSMSVSAASPGVVSAAVTPEGNAVSLARNAFWAGPVFTTDAHIEVTPVVYTGPAVTKRLVYLVNVHGLRVEVSGPTGKSAPVGTAEEIGIDADSGKNVLDLTC